MRFRKKPVVINAWQYLAGSIDGNLAQYISMGMIESKEDGTLQIMTLEGQMQANVGDWIIRGVKGELYPCKPDIFEASYEQVEP